MSLLTVTVEKMIPMQIHLSLDDMKKLKALADRDGSKKAILARTAIKEYLRLKNM